MGESDVVEIGGGGGGRGRVGEVEGKPNEVFGDRGGDVGGRASGAELIE